MCLGDVKQCEFKDRKRKLSKRRCSRSKVSVLTLLDFSAAFNTIDHHILLDHLQHNFGISGLLFFSQLVSVIAFKTPANHVYKRCSV